MVFITMFEGLLKIHEPALFGENQVDNTDQQQGYDAMYRLLEMLGYNEVAVIDNFGSIVLEKVNFDALRNINQYLMAMQHHGVTRTFYYVDVVDTTSVYREQANQAFASYRQYYMKQ